METKEQNNLLSDLKNNPLFITEDKIENYSDSEESYKYYVESENKLKKKKAPRKKRAKKPKKVNIRFKNKFLKKSDLFSDNEIEEKDSDKFNYMEINDNLKLNFEKREIKKKDFDYYLNLEKQNKIQGDQKLKEEKKIFAKIFVNLGKQMEIINNDEFEIEITKDNDEEEGGNNLVKVLDNTKELVFNLINKDKEIIENLDTKDNLDDINENEKKNDFINLENDNFDDKEVIEKDDEEKKLIVENKKKDLEKLNCEKQMILEEKKVKNVVKKIEQKIIHKRIKKNSSSIFNFQNLKKKKPNFQKALTRDDFKKIYTNEMKKRNSLRIKDTSYLKKLFKTKSYKEMEQEKKLEIEQKEKMEEELDEDYNIEEGSNLEEQMDEEEMLIEQMKKNKEIVNDLENEGFSEDNNQDNINDLENKGDLQDQNRDFVENEKGTDFDEEFKDILNKEKGDNNLENEIDLENGGKNNFETEKQNLVIGENDDLDENSNDEDGDKKIYNEFIEKIQIETKGKKLKKIGNLIKEYDEEKKLKKKFEKKRFDKVKKHIKNGFFEIEAELGSENEEHDFIIKKINKNAEDENEEGLDISDEELINKEEQVLIEKNEYKAHKKFLQDMINDEKKQLEKIVKGNFYKNAQRNHDKFLEEKEERKNKLLRMKEMFEFLEENNPFIYKQEESIEKAHLFGIDIDPEDLEEEEEKQKKVYSIEDYKKDLKYILKKYGDKYKEKKNNNFFCQSSNKIKIVKNGKKKFGGFQKQSILDMKKQKGNNKNIFASEFSLENRFCEKREEKNSAVSKIMLFGNIKHNNNDN